jgi:hypothetical protein
MRKFVCLFVAGLFVLNCAALFAQDSKTELPKNLKHPWGSFKEGSFVKFSMVQQDMKMVLSMTLTKLDADFAYISQQLNCPVMGEKEQELKMSLSDFAGASQVPGITLKEKSSSKETVKVGEKDYVCTVIEYDVVPDADKDQEGDAEEGVESNDENEGEEVEPEQSGIESGSVKVWVCEELPVVVKNETRMVANSGAEMNTATTLVALDQKLTVTGKDLICYVYETKTEGAQNAEMKTWMCTDVPGFQVKIERTMTNAAGEEATMTLEVSEYEAK